MASGTTNAEGRYRLETASRSGVIPGEYRATVAKTRLWGFDPTGLPPPPGRMKTEYLTPVQYSNPATSPLRAMVTQGSQNIDFDLTSR